MSIGKRDQPKTEFVNAIGVSVEAGADEFSVLVETEETPIWDQLRKRCE